MTRKELYDQITSLQLQDEVKAYFGKHYTNCSNIQLETIVKEAIANMPDNACPIETRLMKLIEILHNKRILLNSEVKEILY